MEDIILVGYGGHAKSVADCIERQRKYNIIGYTDLQEYESKYMYLGTDEVLVDYYKKGVRNLALCIGYLGKGELRQKIYRRLKQIGFVFPQIVDPSALISSSASLGEGAFVGKYAVVNAEARIGKMAIINTMSLIEHECVVGDFSHVAVAAVLCGQVEVGEAAFIGANSTVIQCRKIESGKIVPAGVTIR